jgi:quercetin dioxygenase-like cupin family protein
VAETLPWHCCGNGETQNVETIMLKRTAILLLAGSLGLYGTQSLAEDTKEDAKIVPLMSKPLGFEGKEGLAIKVEYAPGASTPVHRHDAHVFVYMLQGEAVFQVKGGEPVTLRPGEMFYELPTDIHLVSKNASDTEPAKFLVFFVKDQDKPPVIIAE